MDADTLEKSLRDDIDKADDLDVLEKVRIAYLGRKGSISALLKGIKDAPAEGRRELGAVANHLKQLAERLHAGGHVLWRERGPEKLLLKIVDHCVTVVAVALHQ